MSRRPSFLAALVVSSVLLVACGSTIPTDEEASVLARDELNPALVESTTTTRKAGATEAEKIFLILDSETNPQLLPCLLEVEVQESVAETARANLERLIATEPGRGEAGCSRYFTNFVPTDLRTNSVTVDDEGLATIDVSGLSAVEAGPQRRAVTQIVCTLTDISGVNRVSFYNEGRPNAVQVGDRTTEPGAPISPADFPDFPYCRSNASTPSTTNVVPPEPVEAEPPIGDPAPPLEPLP
jgi:Sporulation and spore germination